MGRREAESDSMTVDTLLHNLRALQDDLCIIASDPALLDSIRARYGDEERDTRGPSPGRRRGPARASTRQARHRTQANQRAQERRPARRARERQGATLNMGHSARRTSQGLIMNKRALTIDLLCEEARAFGERESGHREPSLFGVTDGKAVGTYLEHKFQAHLHSNYIYKEGSSAKGIDLPELEVDLKVTSHRQPQSSCPYKSARQKLYGLGYSLLVFVYDKTDDEESHTAKLDILNTIFVTAARTADFQTTTGIRKIIKNNGNLDDLLAFFAERMLPVDDIEANRLAEEVLENPPAVGYLTISNALQWRLQYSRAIDKAGSIDGILRVR